MQHFICTNYTQELVKIYFSVIYTNNTYLVFCIHISSFVYQFWNNLYITILCSPIKSGPMSILKDKERLSRPMWQPVPGLFHLGQLPPSYPEFIDKTMRVIIKREKVPWTSGGMLLQFWKSRNSDVCNSLHFGWGDRSQVRQCDNLYLWLSHRGSMFR